MRLHAACLETLRVYCCWPAFAWCLWRGLFVLGHALVRCALFRVAAALLGFPGRCRIFLVSTLPLLQHCCTVFRCGKCRPVRPRFCGILRALREHNVNWRTRTGRWHERTSSFRKCQSQTQPQRGTSRSACTVVGQQRYPNHEKRGPGYFVDTAVCGGILKSGSDLDSCAAAELNY